MIENKIFLWNNKKSNFDMAKSFIYLDRRIPV